MEGFLLIDKPAGWTSFDVVKFVRSMVAKMQNVPAKRVKVGHSGTLDPFATGLLIVLVGKNYTKQAQDLLKQDKTYEVVMELDKYSSTGDPEGEIEVSKVISEPPDMNEVKKALEEIQGEQLQTPPAYSAIKVNGVRAYKLARENLPVEIEPRKIHVKHTELINYRYPNIEFKTEVSSGTYIRTLVMDIAASIHREAYTKELKRTSIGNCSIDDAITIDQLSEQTIGSALLSEI